MTKPPSKGGSTSAGGSNAARHVWAPGAHHPKGVSASEIMADCAARGDFTPAGLFEASKSPGHPLHDAIWNMPDAHWAEQARRNYCRTIMASIHETVVVGGKTITTRSVEFVRTKGSAEGRWATIGEIMGDDALKRAYLDEILRGFRALEAKLAKWRELFEGDD